MFAGRLMDFIIALSATCNHRSAVRTESCFVSRIQVTEYFLVFCLRSFFQPEKLA